MCGIICLVRYNNSYPAFSEEEIQSCLETIKARGPDSCSYKIFNYGQVHILLGFTRLAIIDTSEKAMQPFTSSHTTVITNGEVYNYHDLIKKYDITTASSSDCEIIMHLARIIPISSMLRYELDAEFASVILSHDRNKLYAARDRYGVRPLYYGYNNNTQTIGFGSELKSLHPCMEYVEQVVPGKLATINLNVCKYDLNKIIEWNTYFDSKYDIEQITLSRDEIKLSVKKLLTNAVEKRLNSDREIGFLLSGGLDSSLIVAIASRIIGPKNMVCFSIGIESSPDVIAAKSVVEYLGIKNHVIIPFDVNIGINNLEQTIKTVETYDVTTIRASVPQYTMAQYIKNNTSVKVLLSGEGSDEIHGSYRYFRDAPNPEEFDKERLRLLKDLYLFDNKRTDRTMAGSGLEVRVPFLDFDYVNFIMGLDPSLFMYGNNQMEKQLIRDSFEGYLPHDILYRSKEAFSDAVSSTEVNWADAVIRMATKSITTQDMEKKYETNQPLTPDAFYFRKQFDIIYPNRSNVLPYYWLPKFQKEKVIDPSARVLRCY